MSDDYDKDGFVYNPPYKPVEKDHYSTKGGPGNKLMLTIEEQDQLVRMAEVGCTYDEMITILGKPKDDETLRKWYKELIDYGRNIGNNRLRRVQFRKAMEGDVKMLQFLGRYRLGQKDEVEHTHKVLPWDSFDQDDQDEQ